MMNRSVYGLGWFSAAASVPRQTGAKEDRRGWTQCHRCRANTM